MADILTPEQVAGIERQLFWALSFKHRKPLEQLRDSHEALREQLAGAQTALRRLIEAVDSGALVLSHGGARCGYRSYTDLESAANHARAILKEKS